MQHQTATRTLLPLLALAWCQAKAPAQAMMKPQQAQVALGSLPMRAMWAIESNDMATLARLSHSKGVRFSLSVHAGEDDLTLSPARLRTLGRSKTKLMWGIDGGSGDPMRLTWNDFRRKELWWRDFSRGKLVFNTFGRAGSTQNNLREAYTDAIFVESHLDATSQDKSDWGSLWMIWKREGGAWKLRGIAQDYWLP